MNFINYPISLNLILKILLLFSITACSKPTVFTRAQTDANDVSTVETVVEPVENADLRGTLRLAHNLGWGGVESLDPASPSVFVDALVLSYERLLRLNSDGELEASLAKDWARNEDATEWTIHLEEGVLFHDGSELTSEDVRFSLMRVLDPALESPLNSVFNMLDRIETIDDYTIHIYLSASTVDFPILLADRRMSIVPAGLGEMVPLGIGTGPFRITVFDPEEQTYFVAFDEYWQGKPKMKAIVSVALPDASSRTQAMLAGELDFVYTLSTDDKVLFDGRSDFQTQSISTGDWSGIIFRTDIAPFDDIRVRQALRLVVDRKAMLDLALGVEHGIISCDTPIAQTDPYRAELECEQNIPRAKELLREAGYADGLEFTLTTSSLNEFWLPMAEIYQYQAAQAGVRVNIETVPPDGYWSDVWMVEPVVMTNWVERPAAQILGEAYRSDAKWNESYLKQSQLDTLLDDAASTLDFEERKIVYESIQRFLYSEGGSLIPFHLNRTRVIRATVSGIEPIARHLIPWHKVEKKATE